MKNILYIIAITFSVLANAQEVIVPIENQLLENSPISNVYNKDVNNILDKFVGTWVYDTAPHYLKIVVTKVIHKESINKTFNDNLEVRYQYKLNGVEKYNTLSAVHMVDDWYTMGNIIVNNDVKKVKLFHIEQSLSSCWRGRSSSLTLEYIAPPQLTLNSLAQLNWATKYHVRESYNKCPDGTDDDHSDFIIPQSLTLTRQ